MRAQATCQHWEKRLRIIALSSLCLLVAMAMACDNECDFKERCDGDVVEVCGGVDQMVGRRAEAYPCEAPTPTCVEIDGRYARCVANPVTECDGDAFESRCEGSIVLSCGGVRFTTPVDFPHRFVVARDCAFDDRVCALTFNEDFGEERAQCVEPNDDQSSGSD